jgi:predicted ArsR family transcriptional regulator
MSLKDRLISTLKHGKKDVDQLAEELDKSENEIRSRLNEAKTIFKKYPDGWGLLNVYH